MADPKPITAPAAVSADDIRKAGEAARAHPADSEEGKKARAAYRALVARAREESHADALTNRAARGTATPRGGGRSR